MFVLFVVTVVLVMQVRLLLLLQQSIARFDQFKPTSSHQSVHEQIHQNTCRALPYISAQVGEHLAKHVIDLCYYMASTFIGDLQVCSELLLES